MVDIKNFPFLGLIMESLGEKQEKRCLTEFSGVWAYTPGLEFRAVLMVLDQTREDRGDVRHRFEHYVAATRAREHLLVLVRGSDAGTG